MHEQFYNQFSLPTFLKMVIIISSLFLSSFALSPNTPISSHSLFYLYLYHQKHKHILQGTEEVLWLGMPTGRTVCPVGSTYSYSIIQGDRLFFLLWLIFASVRVCVFMIYLPVKAGSIHSTFYSLWGNTKFLHLFYRQYNLETYS